MDNNKKSGKMKRVSRKGWTKYDLKDNSII